jgi:hypothetical protein
MYLIVLNEGWDMKNFIVILLASEEWKKTVRERNYAA